MFRVEVGKGDLRFIAAHFISFLGKCERLHGHNYGVSPVDNITAERLAEYICKRIIETLHSKAVNLVTVTVGVEEAPGTDRLLSEHHLRLSSSSGRLVLCPEALPITGACCDCPHSGSKNA